MTWFFPVNSKPPGPLKIQIPVYASATSTWCVQPAADPNAPTIILV